MKELLLDIWDTAQDHLNWYWGAYVIVTLVILMFVAAISGSSKQQQEFLAWCQKNGGSGYADGSTRVCIVDGKSIYNSKGQ